MFRSIATLGIVRRLAGIVAIALLLTVALAGPTRAANAQVTCVTTYVVQPGDNLFRIGLKFGVSWPTLQAVNNLANANMIYYGQSLCIPASGVVTVPTATPIGPTAVPTLVPPTAVPPTGIVLPPPGVFPSINLSTYYTAPGQTITITGVNFPTNEAADILVAPLYAMLPYVPVASTTTTNTGAVNTQFVIPTTVNGQPLKGYAISVMVKGKTTGYFGYNFFYNTQR
jgi:LysM repeat protein